MNEYDKIMYCGDAFEKLMIKYEHLPVAIVIYIFYNEMNEAFKSQVDKLITHFMREDKKGFQASSGVTSLTHKGDIIDNEFWMKTMGAVNKCGDDMMVLKNTFGEYAFGINIQIFYDSLSEADILTIERLRYLNTKIKEKFAQTGIITKL